MSKAAICVVVPVYKAMATLDRCVESVLAQQVAGGLTCILVDDGSPDESGALDCLLAMPWNKLDRADLAKQLQFDVQYTLGEDLQFVLDYIALLGQTVPEFGYRVMTSPLTFYDCSRGGTLSTRYLLRHLAETLCQAERRLPCRRLPGRGHAPLTPRRIAGVCRGRGRHHAARSLPHPAAERLQGRGRAAQSLAAGAAGADEDRTLLQRLLPALPLA